MEGSKPLVLIIGSGFAGLNAARALKHAPVKVLLVDRNNYHLFQPLLYQVATAGLAPGDIAYPIRTIFRRQANLRFRMTEVLSIDLDARLAQTTTGPLAYDYLVLAVGGKTNFFGLEEVERHSLDLKNLNDAIAIRNRLLRMFELSAQEADSERRQALRTFVVVGGGPTGVECAGAISELIRLVLVKDFPGLSSEDVQVMLLEATGKLLPGFDARQGEMAAKTLRKKHVDVRFNAAVESYDGERVLLKNGESFPAYTLIWAAGVRGSSLANKIHATQGRQGRILVEPTLQIPGRPEVFVAGDLAYLEDEGKPLPMVAPVAIQQGKLAALNIQNLIKGKPLKAFQFRDPGSLATIGRLAAVAEVKGFKFRGLFAWFVWLVVHLYWLIGFRNRLLVLINWASAYIFYEWSNRLITPDSDPETQDTPWPVELGGTAVRKNKAPW